ncbi:MAG: hypothetical protein U9R22_11730 [Pseudomonadota bacterium]|nr:hypothetical protein [Pseudomonadota bacterium]
MPSNVRVVATDEMAALFVDEAGFTLYSSRYDDKAFESKCNDDRYRRVLGRGQAVNIVPDAANRPSCEEAWPPFRPVEQGLAAGDEIGPWKVIARHDDSLQWTYGGKPVYLSSYDRHPAQLTDSHGYLGRTPLFAPLGLPPGMDARLTESGFTLTTSAGYTLYAASGECDRQCQQLWRPFNVPVAALVGDRDDGLAVLTRPDGARQWSHQGEPLYTYGGDLAPGEVEGQGIPGWRPVILKPRAPLPADIRVQMTGDGEVFADRNGLTLYSFRCIDEAPDHLPCDRPGSPQHYRLSICGTPEVCMATWRPLVASQGARPLGNVWTIVPVDPTGKTLHAEEGSVPEPLRVWAYYGRPVFTYVHDKQPGDILGDKVSHLVDWGFWMIKK